MKSIKIHKKKLFPGKRIQAVTGVIVVLVITIVGVHLLENSHAQSPYVNAYAANGQLNSPASLVPGGSNSNGKAVQFGTVPVQPPPTTSRAYQTIGAYSGYENVAGVKNVGTVLGHPVTFMTEYLDYRDPTNGFGSTGQGITNASYISNIQSLQATNKTSFRMVWGLPMLPNVSVDPVTGSTTNCLNSPATCWAQGAQGDYNSYFKTVAQNLVKYGQANSIVRIGWEFNSRSFQGPNPWFAPGYSTQFVSYWQNIVNSMRSVPGQQFVFDWNPNIGTNTIANFPSYYPGDSYVDAVGLDLYDGAWLTYPGAQTNWNSFLNGAQGLNWLATFGTQHGKPITLPEWGLGWTNCSGSVGQIASQTCPAGSSIVGEQSGGDDAYFVQQIAAFINAHNTIESGVWDNPVHALPNSSGDPNATAEFIKDF